MTEEVKSEELSTEDDQQTTNQEPQYTAIEQEAMEQGWVPKDKFTGDPDQWRDAASFVDRGELFKRIDSQKRELKDFRKALADLSKLNKDIRENEYKRALDDLKAQKRKALEDGDADALIEVDERISEVREKQKESVQEIPQTSQDTGEEHPTFIDWKRANPWYSKDKEMQTFADTHGLLLRQKGFAPETVLRKVAEEVRKEFSEKFKNPNQSRTSSVENGSGRTQSKSSFQLTPEERQIMGRFVRTGVMTEQEYIEGLKKAKGV